MRWTWFWRSIQCESSQNNTPKILTEKENQNYIDLDLKRKKTISWKWKRNPNSNTDVLMETKILIKNAIIDMLQFKLLSIVP